MSMEIAELDARAQYISEQYDVPLRAGYALQLAEIGLSNSGIAKQLGVTESTITSYQAQLEERVGARVWEPVSPEKPRYRTYPQDSDEPEYAGDVIDYSPQFSARQIPLNRGNPDLSEELIG